ncbi:MAG: hypothetical protein HZA50_10655 [Planctomycetes bacterium]|nr:hypothetical protein [Planctomycetota bacterium]
MTIMVLCQIGLLVVPVRLQGHRPVTRRHLIWPALIAIFSLIAMGIGAGMAVWETATKLEKGNIWLFSCSAGVGGLWIIWAFLFGFYTGGRDPQTFMRRLVRFLVAGSILELLVAVPTHVIARMRDYCCAGFLTVWGLGLGASVMLLAFGPGVFMLFVRRWQAIKRPPADRDVLKADEHDK